MPAIIPDFKSGVIHPVECVSEGKALIDDVYWSMVGICLVGLLIAGMGPFYILQGPMMCGIAYCNLALKRGEPVEFADLFKGFNYFGPAFLAGLIPNLPMLVIGLPAYVLFIVFTFAVAGASRGGQNDFVALVFPLFWLAWLLIICASLVAHLLGAFSFQLVVEWKMNGWDAFKTSAAAVRANLGGVIVLALLVGLMYLGGLLLFGFGIILVIPLQHAAWTIAYRRVFPEYPHHLDRPPNPPKFREWGDETPA